MDPAAFRPVIQLFAQARPMAVREVAAAAMVCITLPDDACQQLDGLFTGLPAAGRIANHNKVQIDLQICWQLGASEKPASTACD